MPYDADSYEDAYLDYIASEESGFLSSDPPDLIDMDNAVKRVMGLPYSTTRIHLNDEDDE